MNSISRDPAAAASKQPGDCADVDPSAAALRPDAAPQTILPEKQALRTRLLPLRRAALDSGPAVTAAIATGVRAWLDAQDCRCVAFYWPLAGEPDLRATIIAWLAQDGRRRAALPLVVRAATPLRFVSWDADTPMRVGKYGIAVPDHADLSATHPDLPDLALSTRSGDVIPDALLIPCVGFDTRGYRLGYGGGFYDRTLAALHGTADLADLDAQGAVAAPNAGSHSARRPATLGIALDCTLVPALPTDVFDLPLDAIQTESRLYNAR